MSAAAKPTAKSTAKRTPPSKPSDEADEKQLAQAKAEGERYKASLKYMVEDVADTGGQQRAGDYVVGFAQEKAEGMYHLRDGALAWSEPGKDENCHIEIAVLDAADHRFIPYLEITATLTDAEGKEAAAFAVPFVWHPGLYHYGANIALPGDGTYDLAVHIEPPTFMRHDKVNGKRYAKPVDVAFKGVTIKTGRE